MKACLLAYHLSKYVEYADTALLVLKGKPVHRESSHVHDESKRPVKQDIISRTLQIRDAELNAGGFQDTFQASPDVNPRHLFGCL